MTTLTPEDRARLRENAAEGGPWGAVVLALLDALDQAERERDEWEQAAMKLAASSNAANADLHDAQAALDQVERERDNAVAAVERVHALHRSIPIYATCTDPDKCLTPDAEHAEDVGGSGDWLHLDEVEFEACEVCRDEDGTYVEWPCETIRTLDGGGES